MKRLSFWFLIVMLTGGLVGLFDATGGLSRVTGGKFGTFFHWIDGPVSPCTVKIHVPD